MSGGKTTSSFLILYDQLRWEEKSLIEYTKKRGIDAVPLNCREITVDLNKKNDYANKTILQRLRVILIIFILLLHLKDWEDV